MPSRKNKLCNFQLKATMNESAKRWQLMSDNIVEHNDHPILCSEARLAGESGLTPDQMELTQQSYSHGVIPSTIQI